MAASFDPAVALERALPVAREAAELLGRAFRTGVRAREKGRSDLVTECDLASEAVLRKGLAERFPGHGFVGEEGGGEPAPLSWYADPLDGTTNFAHGHPFFCVSLALAREGVPVVGIVIAPALGLEWTASVDGGARRNGTPCRVSDTASLDGALLSTGFPSWRAARPDNNYRAFLALDAASHGVRRCGAAALEIALVADGGYDGFWDVGLKPWDVAAGAILVREAGGVVSDLEGSAAILGAPGFLASNRRLHAAVLEGVRGAIPLPPLGGSSLLARGEVG